MPNAVAAGLRRVWYLTAITCPAEPGAFVVEAGPRRYTAVTFGVNPHPHGVNEAGRTGSAHRPRKIAWEAMMVNSYYGIYQAERGKTTAEIRAADAQLGELATELGQLGSVLAAPARAVRRSLRRQRPAACPAAPDAG